MSRPQGSKAVGNLTAAELRAGKNKLGPAPEGATEHMAWLAKLALLRVMARPAGRDSIMAVKVVLDEARRKPPPRSSGLRAKAEENIRRQQQAPKGD